MFSRTLFWLVAAAYVVHATVLHRKLDRIIRQGARNMTKIDDVNVLLTKIDEETNKVAAEIEDLKNQVANSGGIGGADADAVVARLGAIQSRLQGLAADPENPVPEVPADGGATGGTGTGDPGGTNG